MGGNRTTALGILAAAVWICRLGVELSATGQNGATPDERVALLKQSLEESQSRLRGYEWIETTIITLKGEENGRKQQRCYYGADGKVQKLPIGDAPQQEAAQAAGGRRGGRLKQRIVENKKDEMRDYMERAANLIHLYVPPSPAQIQNAKNAGKLALRPSGQQVRLELTDYVQPGDLMAVDLDPPANRLVGLNVSTYLGERDDTVSLDVRFATLRDGTSYAAQTTLDAKAKNVRVLVQNTGYRPMSR